LISTVLRRTKCVSQAICGIAESCRHGWYFRNISETNTTDSSLAKCRIFYNHHSARRMAMVNAKYADAEVEDDLAGLIPLMIGSVLFVCAQFLAPKA
jgi:hypothetical protein